MVLTDSAKAMVAFGASTAFVNKEIPMLVDQATGTDWRFQFANPNCAADELDLKNQAQVSLNGHQFTIHKTEYGATVAITGHPPLCLLTAAV